MMKKTPLNEETLLIKPHFQRCKIINDEKTPLKEETLLIKPHFQRCKIINDVKNSIERGQSPNETILTEMQDH